MTKYLFAALAVATLFAGCGKREGYVAQPNPPSKVQLWVAGEPFMVGGRFKVTYLKDSPSGTYWQLIEDTEGLGRKWLQTDKGIVEYGR